MLRICGVFCGLTIFLSGCGSSDDSAPSAIPSKDFGPVATFVDDGNAGVAGDTSGIEGVVRVTGGCVTIEVQIPNLTIIPVFPRSQVEWRPANESLLLGDIELGDGDVVTLGGGEASASFAADVPAGCPSGLTLWHVISVESV